jgi:antitoxin Phd
MKVYTYSQARQRLASLLNQARREGEVRIRRRDGQDFILQPAAEVRGSQSPLDVPGVTVPATTKDILEAIRESRGSTERLLRKPLSNKRMQPTGRRGRSSVRPRVADGALWNVGLCAGGLDGPQLMRMSLDSATRPR